MTLSCSRRKNSRWCFWTLSLTSSFISACSRATSCSLRISSNTFSIRRNSGTVSSTSCNSVPRALVIDAPKSASGELSSGPNRDRYCLTSSPYNGLVRSRSLMALMMARVYALSSSFCSSGSSGYSTSTRYGGLRRSHCTIRILWTPWAMN